MRFVVDARLNAYRRGGIPEYTRQLVTALAALRGDHTIITLQHREQQRPLVLSPKVQRRTALTPPHHRLEQWTLPLELLPLRPDLLHCPDFIVPLRRPCPAVVTIHDLAFLHYPEILDDNARRFYSLVRESVHSAEAVIAVSEATRNDIVALLELPAERIDVVYEAAAPHFQQLELEPGATKVIGGHALEAGAFALFVSTLEPRKNLPTLLKALRLCLDRRPDVGYQLAVAGAKGWRYQGIFDSVRDLGLADSVLFLGSVGAEELRWLYNACRIYANPSLYEGFGLPVLEALACGAPTIVSSTSSLPELVGDRALLLPPLDVQAWADTIEQLWHDPDQRAALAAGGPDQAARFSWQRAADQTLAIYRHVASGGKGQEEVSSQVASSSGELDSSSVAEPIVDLDLARDSASAQLTTRSVAEPILDDREATSLPVTTLPTSNDNGMDVLDILPAAETTDALYSPVVELEPLVAAQQPAAIQPTTESPHPTDDTVSLRACLRCSAPLEAGLLLGAASWRAIAAPDQSLPTALRAWACPRCGAVELMLNPSTDEPQLSTTLPAATEATAAHNQPRPVRGRMVVAANSPANRPAPAETRASRKQRSGKKGP